MNWTDSRKSPCNVRLRIEPKLFCYSWSQYGDYPAITLPDGRVEIALGDLVSEERRDFVLLTEVLPLPLLPDGELPTSLEGEGLLESEFLWTAIEATEIKSCTSKHLVRIQGTQNPQDVVLNQEVIAQIANQIAGKAAREAAAKVREGNFDQAAASIYIKWRKATSATGKVESDNGSDERQKPIGNMRRASPQFLCRQPFVGQRLSPT
jgi:hypothetical protein